MAKFETLTQKDQLRKDLGKTWQVMSHLAPTWNILSESIDDGLTLMCPFFSNSLAHHPKAPLWSLLLPHPWAQVQHLYTTPLAGACLPLPSPTMSSLRAAGSFLSFFSIAGHTGPTLEGEWLAG